MHHGHAIARGGLSETPVLDLSPATGAVAVVPCRASPSRAQAQLLRDWEAIVGPGAGSWALTVSAGSVQITFQAAVANRAAYDLIGAAVASSFASLGAISAALGVQPLALPLISAINEHPNEDDAPVIAGAAVGAIAGGLLLCGVALAVRRRRRRAGGKYLVTTVVPVAPAPSSSTDKESQQT